MLRRRILVSLYEDGASAGYRTGRDLGATLVCMAVWRKILR